MIPRHTHQKEDVHFRTITRIRHTAMRNGEYEGAERKIKRLEIFAHIHSIDLLSLEFKNELNKNTHMKRGIK